MDNNALIRAYWQAAEDRDWDAFGALVATDVVYREPQTREIVRGRNDYVAFNQTYPATGTSPWTGSLPRRTKG